MSSYDGLSRALMQIGNDYANNADEQRKYERAQAEEQRKYGRAKADESAIHNRNRGEKKEDDTTAYERDVAKTVLASNIRYSDYLRESAERRKQDALALGIDPEGMSPQDLYKARNDAIDARAATVTENTAVNQNAAAKKIARENLNDPLNPKDIEKQQELEDLKNSKVITAAQGDFNNAQAELRRLQEKTPALGQITTVGDLAQQKLSAFFAEVDSLPPDQRAARIKAEAASVAGKSSFKNEADARGLLNSQATFWAMSKQLVTQADAAAIEKRNAALLTQTGLMERPEITGLIARINNAASTLIKMGVTPGGVASASTFFGPSSHEEAPGDVQTPAAPAGPKFSIPGAAVQPPGSTPAVPAPVTVAPVATSAPVAAPATPAAPSWWSPERDGAANQEAVKSAVAGIPSAIGGMFTGVAQRMNPQNYVPGPMAGSNSVVAFDPARAARERQRNSFGGLPDMGPSQHRIEAEQWLTQAGMVLNPTVKETLLSKYEQLMSSGLPQEELVTGVQQLQLQAQAADERAAMKGSPKSFFSGPGTGGIGPR